MAIPPHLIFDPFAPVPARMSKKERDRLHELREAYQASMRHSLPKTPLNDPDKAAAFLIPFLAHHTTEVLMCVALNSRSRAIDVPILVSRGDVDGTDAGPRAVLRSVLVQEATSFLVAHNHPTGDPNPSPADIAVTRRLIAGGQAVDCPMVDHIIIGRGGAHYSLRRAQPGIWSGVS